MIEISTEVLTLIMLGGIVVGVLSGYPLAIPIGAMGLIVGYLLFGPSIFSLAAARMFGFLKNYTVLAAPLFIFMGNMLEQSGMAERLFTALNPWFGKLRGGMLIVTLIMGTILAATVGVVAASVIMLTLVALPPMMKHGYDKSIAAGAICAGGTLGILIPPSTMLVLFGPMAGLSVGRLFMAAIGPGLLLSGLYIVYVFIRCLFEPELAPSVPIEERAVPFRKKVSMLLASLVPPVALVMAVLGAIFFGIAAPTEAAAVGVIAAIALTFIYRGFKWDILRRASLGTFKMCGLLYLIGCCACVFVAVFLSAGCGKIIEKVFLAAPGGIWGIFVITQFIIFILGFFVDWLGILFIMVPLVIPVITASGFDPLWYSMMVCVNLQTSFITPPFAYAIFYLKGTAPPELGVKMSDIIRGVFPFVILVLVALGLCTAFPEIITWLPHVMIK